MAIVDDLKNVRSQIVLRYPKVPRDLLQTIQDVIDWVEIKEEDLKNGKV